MRKRKIFFVKRAKIWDNIKIPSCHSFYYFTDVYKRIASNYYKRKEVHQSCSNDFRTKLKIYLNKYEEKALLSETTNSESV